MRAGVYGYLFVPFQPGEAGIMVQRALEFRGLATPGTQPVTDEAKPSKSLGEEEERLILDTLRRCKNNQARTARVLGIGRNTLWRKLKKMKQKPSHLLRNSVFLIRTNITILTSSVAGDYFFSRMIKKSL